MLYFIGLYRQNNWVDFTPKDMTLAFEQWRRMDREPAAMNDPRHAARVEQAWRQYCHIRDLLTIEEDDYYTKRPKAKK